jgi:hypothetical protein
VGCSRGRGAAKTTAASAPVVPASLLAQAPAVPHGLRKELNLDVPVFVDGKQVAVLRYGELPPGVPATTNPTDEEHRVGFYRLWDYLQAIGVNPERVKAVHYADKVSRIGGVEGSELRADKNRFVFDFLGTTGGIVKPAWSTGGLKTRLFVDGMHAVNVFVSTTPWEIDRVKHCYVEDDDCKPVARFTDGDVMKGTRIYDDGKLVGYVKRRLLSDDTIVGKKDDGDPLYSVDRLLASLGVKADGAKEIRLLAGDDVVASATAAEWAARKDALTFYLVKHGHGKVRANVPAALQIKQEGTRDRDVQVTSIQVFEHKEPRAMSLVSIDAVIDPGPNAAAVEDAVAQTANAHEGRAN